MPNCLHNYYTEMIYNLHLSLCNFVHPIFLVNDNVTRHDCIGVVDDNFSIVQAAALLSVHTVIPLGWALQVDMVCLKYVLSARAHRTKEHGSVAISTLSVVMTLG